MSRTDLKVVVHDVAAFHLCRNVWRVGHDEQEWLKRWIVFGEMVRGEG